MASKLLTDITVADEQTVPATFADIPSMSQVVTVNGTGSVVILIATVTLKASAATDEGAQFRFTHDGSFVGPDCVNATKDEVDEGNGMTIIHALSGLSAGSHTFAVQWEIEFGSPESHGTFERTFQVIEIQDNASIIIDKSLTDDITAPAIFADLTGMTGTVTPTANSLHIFIANTAVVDTNSVEATDLQFASAGTLEGPVMTNISQQSDHFHGTGMVYCRTGLAASSQTLSLQWQKRTGTSHTSGRTRTFQVIEITDDFVLETDIELTSAHDVGTSYEIMTGMTDTTVNVDSTDSVMLALANFMMTDTGDSTELSRIAIDSTQVGPELMQFADSTNQVSGNSVAWADTGLSAGNHQFDLQWVEHKGAVTLDTGRARTFQVIDLKTVTVGALSIPVAMNSYRQRHNYNIT